MDLYIKEVNEKYVCVIEARSVVGATPQKI